jgi:hypothetical protein
MCVFFPGNFPGRCQICTWVGNLSVGAAAGICSELDPLVAAAAVNRKGWSADGPAEQLHTGNHGMVTALSATWGILLALGLLIDFGGFLTWVGFMKKLRQAALANPANMLNGSVQKLRLKVIDLSFPPRYKFGEEMARPGEGLARGERRLHTWSWKVIFTSKFVVFNKHIKNDNIHVENFQERHFGRQKQILRERSTTSHRACKVNLFCFILQYASLFGTNR